MSLPAAAAHFPLRSDGQLQRFLPTAPHCLAEQRGLGARAAYQRQGATALWWSKSGEVVRPALLAAPVPPHFPLRLKEQPQRFLPPPLHCLADQRGLSARAPHRRQGATAWWWSKSGEV